MSLPRPPISLNTPIPNEPFSAEEVYYLEGNQGHLPLGAGLYIDPATGQFTNIEPSPYIYCTPAYPGLPPTSPPYGCDTEVNTTGVTDFTGAWENCGFSEFPCVDSSAVVDFSSAWSGCENLTSFPRINTSSGENFYYSWAYSGLTSFPLLNFSNGTDFTASWSYCGSLTSFPPLNLSSGTEFYSTWYDCSSLETFPVVDVSSGTNFGSTWGSCSSLTSFPPLNFSSGTDFGAAWGSCTSLTDFPAGMFDSCSATNFIAAWFNCSLNQASVDNILVSLDTAGQSNGIVNIDGGTSSAPGAAGLAAKASLEAKGWTVTVNGVSPLGDYAEEAKFEFPNDPKPGQLFTSPEGKKYKWGRSRLENGWFAADIPSTPEDEAWEWLLIEDSPQEEK